MCQGLRTARERARDDRPDHPGGGLQGGAVVLQGVRQAAHAGDDEHAEREDDRRVPEREPEADAQRPLTLRHQLARGVVDRRDVVGVERVAQAQRVCRDPEPDAEHAGGAELVALRRHHDDQQEEPGDVQGPDRGGEQRDAPALRGRERPQDARPPWRGRGWHRATLARHDGRSRPCGGGPAPRACRGCG